MTTTQVTLQNPIARGAGEAVRELTLRKPASGELRGLKLMDLLQMDVNALAVLLPRIAQPSITKADIEAMDMADVLELGVAVIGFFEAKPAPAAPAQTG